MIVYSYALSAESMAVIYTSFAQKYHDSSVTLTINKATGLVEKVVYDMNIDISIKGLKMTVMFVPAFDSDLSFSVNNKVAVDVTIIVDYGSPVPNVARSIQENVKKAIETMSGLDVRSVDVHVQGVSFEKENKAVAELTENQKKFLENTSAEEQKAAEPEKEEEIADEELEFEIELPEVDEEEEKA